MGAVTQRLLFNIGPALTPAPAWAPAILPGYWGTISNNTIDDVKTAVPLQGSVSNLVGSWNSGILVPTYGAYGGLLVMGSGHAGASGYVGNESYMFDLGDAAEWELFTEAYSGATGSYVDADGWWPAEGLQVNGSPTMPHTYDSLVYHGGLDAAVLVRRQTVDETPSVMIAGAILPISTRVWIKGTQYGGSGNPANSGGWGVYDESRDICWFRGGQTTARLATYDPKTEVGDGTGGTWVDKGGNHGSGSYGRAAYDPVNDILVRFDPTTDLMYGIPCVSTPTTGSDTALTTSGKPASLANAAGWEWSTRLGGIVYWDTGGTVYKIVKGAGSWQTATWTWSVITDAGNSVTPTKTANGTFGRFRIAKFGDEEFAIVVNSTTGPVYAFRIP